MPLSDLIRQIQALLPQAQPSHVDVDETGTTPLDVDKAGALACAGTLQFARTRQTTQEEEEVVVEEEEEEEERARSVEMRDERMASQETLDERAKRSMQRVQLEEELVRRGAQRMQLEAVKADGEARLRGASSSCSSGSRGSRGSSANTC